MKPEVKEHWNGYITGEVGYSENRLYWCYSARINCPFRVKLGWRYFCIHPKRKKFVDETDLSNSEVRE